MLNFYKFVEIIVSLQTIIISTMLPIYIPLPFMDQTSNSFELPITWNIPTLILLTLIFGRKAVFSAFTIYIIIGLFFYPVFLNGGSIGYLLTPDFGYLLGTYALIRIIDNLNKNNNLKVINFLKNGFMAIIALHITGIIYNVVPSITYNQFNLFFYNLGKYSAGKILYHLITLLPLLLLIKPIKYFKKAYND